MPSTRPLLVFDLAGELFAVDATLVRESVWLPELTPVEESPSCIVGMFSLRDRLIPVTDINLRFGHPPRPYRIEDQLVVLEQDGLAMGIIVSEVREVVELPHSSIQPPPQTMEGPHAVGLVAGEIRVGDDIVMLLDAARLLHLAQGMELPVETHPVYRFCPEATPEQRAIFRARATALREASASDEDEERLALAVLELGGEYFGVELSAVQEFCNIVQPSPIPCCPPHILGAMNLRGNLFTLLDLRAALNLSRSRPEQGGKAVIARLGEQAVGIAVDEVHDVVYLRREELHSAPALLHEQHLAEVMGAAPYAGKMLVVLDLPALLAREEWVVNES